MVPKSRHLPVAAAEMLEALVSFCGQREIDTQQESMKNGVKLRLARGTDRASINVFPSDAGMCSVVYDQPASPLSEVVDSYLVGQTTAPVGEPRPMQNRCGVYRGLAPATRNAVRDEVSQLGGVEVTTPDQLVEWALNISRGPFSVRVTQYSAGTLVLQGRGTALWDEVCTAVERVCEPEVSDMAVRFVSRSSEEADRVARILSPGLVRQGRANAQAGLGSAFPYLSEQDAKYMVSSYCLADAGLELPEYSCVVMPAAKCLEGYLKELFVDLGFVTQADVDASCFNFGQVWSSKAYGEALKGDRDRETFLRRLRSELEYSRHFTMHSSAEPHRQVDTLVEAREDIGRIAEDIRESCKFFGVGRSHQA